MSDNYRVEQVFESEVTIDADTPLAGVFDAARLDHMIKFHHDDAATLRADGRTPRRLRYRIVVYVAEVESDER